jgi:antitoxin ParD1/3/4
MSTMNVSLPESLKAFVDQQVEDGHYGTSSEYVRELIRRDQERTRLRNLILEGAASPPVGYWDDAYFARMRTYIRERAGR